jgi:hypothetical protein
MSQTELAAFQKIVLEDPALQAALREMTDQGAFIAAVSAAARSRGLDVCAEDILTELIAASRAWVERWIV